MSINNSTHVQQYLQKIKWDIRKFNITSKTNIISTKIKISNLHIKIKLSKVSGSMYLFIYPVFAVSKYKNKHTHTHKCMY